MKKDHRVYNVALCPGTATDTVVCLLERLGANVHIVQSLKRAQTVHFDGLLLLGGTDINSKFYGQVNEYCYPPDRQRDAREWVLMRRALDHDYPIFGICRGHQFLAVACGGSLWQDVNAQDVTRSSHSGMAHRLNHVKGHLSRRLPSLTVNSYHHQSIRRVPFGFKVMALSDRDGIIESIWRPGCLGVQFHPEMMYHHDRDWESLFVWFLQGLR